MNVKEESEKVGLKLNIQKTKIMASGPITSWEIDGETVETVSDFIFEGSKITADGDCSHEIKRCFTPLKKSYDQNGQHIKKERHYFANKGLSSQGYGCKEIQPDSVQERLNLTFYRGENCLGLKQPQGPPQELS